MSDMYGLVVLLYLIAYLSCLFFLYKFKKVGKQSYLFLFIFGVLLSLLMGDSAQGPLSYVVDGLGWANACLLYTSPSPRDATLSRMPSSA